MHEQWEHKKRRSGGMSNPHIDEWYELGRKNGAHRRQAGRRRRRRLPACSTPRTIAGCATAMTKAGLEEVRFRFDFEGTKVLLRREPAGRDSRRRAGHAAAAGHRDDSRRRSSRWPAGRLPSTRSSCLRGQGIDATSSGSSGTARDQIESALGDGSRWDHAVQLRASTGRSCSAPAARSPGAAAARRRVLRDVRRLVPGVRFRRRRARVPRERPRRPDDGVPQRRAVRHAATCEFEDGRIVRYDKTIRTPAMHHIDYGLGVLDGRARSRRIPTDEPLDLAPVYQDLLAAGELAGLRGAEPVLRNRIARGPRRDRASTWRRRRSDMRP